MRQQCQRIGKPVALFAIAGFVLAVMGRITTAEEPTKTPLFVSGKEGYHTFRIPSLIVTQFGTLLATCEGRKTGGSDAGDIDLVMKRSDDYGKTWSPLKVIYEEGGDAKITIGNPCPVIDPKVGKTWMPFCRNNDDVLMMHSKDEGKTWSKPVTITKDVKKTNWNWYATGPGIGIQLEHGKYKGRLVIPCDHGETINGKRVMFSHVFYSDDHGKTWKLGGSLDRHTDECQVVELSDGRLKMNARNYWGRAGGRPERGNMRAISYSSDGGDTWSRLTFDKTLIEPICQASFVSLPIRSDDVPDPVLFSNPASKKSRHRLTIRMSVDGGNEWLVSKLLHAGPAAYSCLTVQPDGSIACLYEGGEKNAYEKIIFARFRAEWLIPE